MLLTLYNCANYAIDVIILIWIKIKDSSLHKLSYNYVYTHNIVK